MTDATCAYIHQLEAQIAALYRQASSSELAAIVEAVAAAKNTLIHETHGMNTPDITSALRYATATTSTGRTETILFVTLYGANRSADVLASQQRVMEHMGIPVNYVQAHFPAVSHGSCMNRLIEQTVDLPAPPDYYAFLDIDCVPLRREAVGLAYHAVEDHLTVWGHSWQSNHKAGPNGMIPHAYASQACLFFPRDLYLALGRPDMDHWVPRSDTAEELTYKAKAAGFSVNLLYPSHSVLKNVPLDNGMGYGMGNTYGPLSRPLWHHTSYTNDVRHVEVFTETCKMVLADAFEGDKPALPYGYVAP